MPIGNSSARRPDQRFSQAAGHYRIVTNNFNQNGKFTLTEDLRDIVMVAGTDPYACKPVVDLNRPYLRTEALKIKTDRRIESPVLLLLSN